MKIISMVRFFAMVLGVGIALVLSSLTANAQADKKQESGCSDKAEKISRADMAGVKITMETARATALGRVSGTITEEDLEKENGRVQYAFDIRDSSGKVWDVEIDAATGAILKASDDSDDDDAAENVSAAESKSVKISIETARTTALKRISGEVVEEELEKENGRLQYAFDIRDAGGKVWDVEIDATTGEILKATDEDDEDGENEKIAAANATTKKR